VCVCVCCACAVRVRVRVRIYVTKHLLTGSLHGVRNVFVMCCVFVFVCVILSGAVRELRRCLGLVVIPP
jgi:hypothetical protein